MGKSGLELAAAAAVPVPPGAMEGGLISNTDALAQALMDLMSAAPFSKQKVIASISGQGATVTRVLDLEKMTQKDLDAAMKLDMERHVPFPADEVEADYKIIDVPGPEDSMKVLLAAAEQEALNNELLALKQAKLSPSGIEVPPLAAGRAVMVTQDGGAYGDGSGKTIAVVDMGYSGTTLSVFHNGWLVFVRNLNMGSENLNRAITQEFTLEAEEAERIKCELGMVLGEETAPASGGGLAEMGDMAELGSYQDTTEGPVFQDTLDGPVFDIPDDELPGVPSEEPSGEAEPAAQEPAQPAAAAEPEEAESFTIPEFEQPTTDEERELGQVITPLVGDLVAELTRSLEFYQSRNPDFEVERLFLAGGMASLKNIVPYMASQLGLPVALADVAGAVQLGPNVDPEQARKLSPMLVTAVGLALRDML